MIRPPQLKPGDTIAIAATARKISLDELNPGIRILESWGLKIRFSKGLFAEEHQFAGSDEERETSMQELLDDSEIKAIIIARGGYGTVRIIDQLSFAKFVLSPKWIIGFSDITVLHSHIHTHFGIETIHGPMMLNFISERYDELSISRLKELIMHNDSAEILTGSCPLNRLGVATGTLVGGNLSVLYSLLGSASDIGTFGKLLFLEDLDEYLYHIDRMMMNLKRNGKLQNIAGLIIGDMSDMKDNTIPFGKNAIEIIHSHIESFNYPVCFGFPAGHEKINLSLMMGARYKLEVLSEGSKLSVC